jgi:hypothetical protein
MDLILLALAALQYALAAAQVAGLLVGGVVAVARAPEPTAIISADAGMMLPIDEDW